LGHGEFIAQAENEIRVRGTANIEHNHILKLLGYAYHGGFLYMVEDYSIERLQDRMYGMLLPTEISIHSVQVSISTSFFRGKTLRFCFNLIKPQLAESTTYKPSNIHTTHRRAPRSSKKHTCQHKS
jgi:hypothetical protein